MEPKQVEQVLLEARGGLVSSAVSLKESPAIEYPATARIDSPLISVVAPVYNEEQLVRSFYERVVSALESEVSFQIIFVDDGSSDRSAAILKEIAAGDERVSILRFSRNFGHQMAITAGLDFAVGDAVAIIDSDLQDPPEVLVQMIAKWREGSDVAYGVRIERQGETRFKLVSARLFYRVVNFLSDTPLPEQSGDFRLLDRKVVDALKQLREENRYLRGMIAWLGFKQTPVDYVREIRSAGATKYSLRKMMTLALDGITSFSERPLRLATGAGLVITSISFLYTVTVVTLFLLDRSSAVAGYTSVFAAVLFLSGVQLLSIGMLGTYVGRIYKESKSRPLYVISDAINISPNITRS